MDTDEQKTTSAETAEPVAEPAESSQDNEFKAAELAAEPGDQAPVPKPKRHKRDIVILIIVLIVAAGLAGFLTWRHYQNKPAPVAAATQTKVLTSQIPKSQTESGVALLEKPMKASNLNLFSNYNTFFGNQCANSNCSKERPTKSSDLTYYNLGKINGKSIIAIEYPYDGIGSPGIIVAEQTGASKYSILAKYTDGLDDGSGYDALTGFSKTLADNVSVDQIADIPAFDFPASINVDNLKLAADDIGDGDSYVGSYFTPGGLVDIRGSSYGNVAAGTQPIKVDSVDGRDIYEVTAINSKNYQSKEWYATYNQVWAANYNVTDSLDSPTNYSNTTQPTVKIDWTSGQNNISAYGKPFVSCGTDGYMVAKNTGKSELKAIGTGPDGQTVYALPDNSPLVNELYSNDYKGTESSISNKSLRNLTLQQFQNDHAVIVSINPLGELVVHVRSEMFLGGGCGKPVVYLYPTKPTTVSVKVGAEVVKSDPLYSAISGWQNVLARPGSQLSYQGKNYDSLFWEGYGNGRYPAITSGTVVKSSQAPATIRQQLQEQGLNAKEINDFMAFWQPRLPHTPYVRLTWFGTSQMQQIAPLTISPRPNTLIRAFLDFEGLEHPIQLTPQHFLPPARNGFTVVEWGGLLRGGIH